MASDWTAATLGETADLKNGKGLKNSFYKGSGKYPVWGANGRIARTDRLLNEQPVVVIGRVGAYCGSIHAVFEPNWVTDNAIVATPKEGNDFRFLFYLLKYLRPERTSIGSAQPLVTQTGLKTLKHSRPPLPEQRAIAHILGTLDDKIELNRKMNETLEAMARAIFKSWFVDFDPVRAKAEGRKPSGMAPVTAALFPDAFQNSPLGKIPRGWDVKVFQDFVAKSSERVGERDIPEFSCTNNGLVPRSERFKKQLSQSKAKNKVIRKNDLVFGLSRQILNFGVMQDSIGAVSPAYHVFPINTSVVSGDYVEKYMRQRMHVYFAILGASSREGQAISIQQFLLTGLLIPPRNVRDRYQELVSDFENMIARLEDESNTLAAVRDTLLPKLLSGEIRVKDAEKFVEEVA